MRASEVWDALLKNEVDLGEGGVGHAEEYAVVLGAKEAKEGASAAAGEVDPVLVLLAKRRRVEEGKDCGEEAQVRLLDAHGGDDVVAVRGERELPARRARRCAHARGRARREAQKWRALRGVSRRGTRGGSRGRATTLDPSGR